MSKIIKNNDYLRQIIEQCLDIKKTECKGANRFPEQLEFLLNQELFNIKFLQDLKSFWNQNFPNDKIYVHKLLAKTELYLPKYQPEPRNSELEKRIQNIKANFENEAYQNMVYNIDRNSKLRLGQDKSFKSSGYSAEFKSIQGQLIVIINAIACIIASFYFGYKAVYYSLDEPDINLQMIGGFFLAMIVAIAEIYFLFKKLNEMDTYDPEKIPKKQKVQPKLHGKSTEVILEKSKVDKKKD